MPRSTHSLLNCTTRAELAVLLDIDLSKLTYYAYARGNKYREFTIPKKSGGTRTINAPVGGLNEIQKKLAKLLTEIYRPHPAAHGFINNKSVLSNASNHLLRTSVLNIDLEDFFPSITGTRIMGLLKSKGFGLNSEVASTIAALATHNNRLPQGAATSPILSNMIAYRMDHQLTRLSKANKIRYSRYADDITFSSRDRSFNEEYIKYAKDNEIVLGDVLVSIIKSNYFNINQSKIRMQSGMKSKYVTGVKVNVKPNLSRSYIRELRSMINAWEKHGLENAQKYFNLKYNGRGRPFESVVVGKLSYLRQIKGKDDLVYLRLNNRVLALQQRYDEIAPIGDIETICSKLFVIHSGVYGTAFILDNKWIITCEHVIKSDTTKIFPSNKSAQIKYHREVNPRRELMSGEDRYDLAAIDIPKGLLNDSNAFFSAPEGKVVETGDFCKVVGFPEYYLGSSPSVVEGKVIKVERNKYGVQEAYFDRILVVGNSGGPVLNKDNELIGIVRTGSPDKENSKGFGSTFLPIQEIRKCLREFENV